MISSISAEFISREKANEAINIVRHNLTWIYSITISDNNESYKHDINNKGIVSSITDYSINRPESSISKKGIMVYIVTEKSYDDYICSMLKKNGGVNIKVSK